MVVGNPLPFAKQVQKELNGHGFVFFERFRTARLTLPDAAEGELELEFVGARKESYNPESRKPITKIGTVQDDLSRRDFTINALALSLNQTTFGQKVDLFHGLEDLQHKLIRTPLEPGQTFSDDPLRMMRAVRFASQLGFTIQPEVLEAIKAMRGRFSIISKERIRDELFKIMLSPVPSVGLGLLHETGLMNEFLPELSLMAGVEQVDGVGHKDTFYHTLKVVDNVSEVTEDLWLRFAALFHDVGKPRTKRFRQGAGWTFHGHDAVGANMLPKLFKRMTFPLSHLDYVRKLVRLHLRPIPLSHEEITDSAVRRLMFEAGEDLDDLMRLCRADVTSKNPRKVQRIMANFANVEQKISEVSEKDLLAKWRPPVNGSEIMEMFNIPEGKLVGMLKKNMENAIIDGLLPYDRQKAIEFLEKEYAALSQSQDSPKQVS
jgi:poly(A) polymerase